MPHFKYTPLVNLVIATSALGFQVFVLYPWHHELSRDFNTLHDKVTGEQTYRPTNTYFPLRIMSPAGSTPPPKTPFRLPLPPWLE
jgi:hypothetical protein